MKPLLGLILTLSVASLFDIPAGAGEQPLKPGQSSFKDCAECPEMAAAIASAAVPGPALLTRSDLPIVAGLQPATRSASSVSGSGARSISKAPEVSS